MGYNGNNRKLRTDMFPKRSPKLRKKDIDAGLGLLAAPLFLFLTLVELAPVFEKIGLFLDKRTKKLRSFIIRKKIFFWMLFINLGLYILGFIYGNYILLFIGLLITFILIASCKVFVLLLSVVTLLVSLYFLIYK